MKAMTLTLRLEEKQLLKLQDVANYFGRLLDQDKIDVDDLNYEQILATAHAAIELAAWVTWFEEDQVTKLTTVLAVDLEYHGTDDDCDCDDIPSIHAVGREVFGVTKKQSVIDAYIRYKRQQIEEREWGDEDDDCDCDCDD